MDLYAIRVGNWVEIREASSPPKKVVQTLKITPKKRRYYDEDADCYRMKSVSKIERIFYKGGVVIGHMNTNQLVKAAKLYVYDFSSIKKEYEEAVRKGMRKC